MYAVAFDLVVADTEKHHPKGVREAYTEIGAVLAEHGFQRVQEPQRQGENIRMRCRRMMTCPFGNAVMLGFAGLTPTIRTMTHPNRPLLSQDEDWGDWAC